MTMQVIIDSFLTSNVSGNDLARVLKWGGGYQSTDDLYAMLQNVHEAEEVRLDR